MEKPRLGAERRHELCNSPSLPSSPVTALHDVFHRHLETYSCGVMAVSYRSTEGTPLVIIASIVDEDQAA